MSADGRLLATASKDGMVDSGRCRTAAARAPRCGSRTGPPTAQLSPDGRWLSVRRSIATSSRTGSRSGTSARRRRVPGSSSRRRRRVSAVQPGRPAAGRRRPAAAASRCTRRRRGRRSTPCVRGRAGAVWVAFSPRRRQARRRQYRRNRPPVGRRERPGARRAAARACRTSTAVPIFPPDDTAPRRRPGQRSRVPLGPPAGVARRGTRARSPGAGSRARSGRSSCRGGRINRRVDARGTSRSHAREGSLQKY